MKLYYLSIVLACKISLDLAASAQTTGAVEIIVPSSAENTPGSGRDNSIFTSGFPSLQQVYASSQFNAPFGLQITGINLRVDENSGQGYNATLRGLEIKMSTYQRPLQDFSAAYEANKGSDELVVFSGDIALNGSFLGSGRVNPFDLRIPLQTPFFFNPNAGHLLIHFVSAGTGGLGGAEVDLATGRIGNDIIARRAWFDSNPFGGGPVINNEGYAMKIDGVAVPEPCTIGLILVGFLVFLKRFT